MQYVQSDKEVARKIFTASFLIKIRVQNVTSLMPEKCDFSVFCTVEWWGSSVGLATELRAGRSGIESRRGRDIPPVQTGPVAQLTSCKKGTGSFPGVKCGRGAWGTAVAQWLRCCATNRKVVGSIPAGVIGCFIDIKSFRSHYDPGVDWASDRNEYQEYFLGVTVAGA